MEVVAPDGGRVFADAMASEDRCEGEGCTWNWNWHDIQRVRRRRRGPRDEEPQEDGVGTVVRGDRKIRIERPS